MGYSLYACSLPIVPSLMLSRVYCFVFFFFFYLIGMHSTVSAEAARQVVEQARAHSAAGLEDLLRHYRISEAIRRGDREALTALLDTYVGTAVPACGEILGATPFHVISALGGSGDAALLELLLEKVPFLINAQDAAGQTALHLAVRSGKRALVARLLRERNIDDTIKNKDGIFGLEMRLPVYSPYLSQKKKAKRRWRWRKAGDSRTWSRCWRHRRRRSSTMRRSGCRITPRSGR